MKPYRSMLFTHGRKPTWVEKGLASWANALIVDLEDPTAAGAERRRTREHERRGLDSGVAI
jgi:citrate lyase subunit beta/citryl-CoA lyase